LLDSFFELASGEILLRLLPNGGLTVFLRSLWVTAWIFAVAIGMYSCLQPNTIWVFDASQARELSLEHFRWLGPIFAATYAAFYARYASQWSYLANLYNQIMDARYSTNETDCCEETLSDWHAAFVQDAEALHLATNPMFAPMIVELLGDDEVAKSIEGSELWGKERVARLKGKVEKAVERQDRKFAFRLGLDFEKRREEFEEARHKKSLEGFVYRLEIRDVTRYLAGSWKEWEIQNCYGQEKVVLRDDRGGTQGNRQP